MRTRPPLPRTRIARSPISDQRSSAISARRSPAHAASASMQRSGSVAAAIASSSTSSGVGFGVPGGTLTGRILDVGSSRRSPSATAQA